MTPGSDRRPRVFGVLMTRDSEDLLAVNILRHLQTGCDRVLVVDNGSSDGSHRILRRLAKRHPVEWTSDTGALNQSEIVTAMAADAHAKGADWVIPLDTDEFWHATRPFDEILREAEVAGVGALEAPRIEFVQRREQRRSSPAGALHATMRAAHPLGGVEPIEEFRRGERSMFELLPAPKLLMRTTADLKIHRGAHTAEHLAGPVEVSPEIVIFHLPLRSRADLEARGEHGRRIEQISSDPYVSVQNRYWAQMDAENRLDEAWLAHSFKDGALTVGDRRVELVRDLRLKELLEPWAAPLPRRLQIKVERRLDRR